MICGQELEPPSTATRSSSAFLRKPLQLAARLLFLETPERRDHLLANLAAVVAAAVTICK
jgi:hypothetical protein